ncbi:hypothetical protein H9L10_14295 [Phycicoccus endophyticus]|uniref:Uncharacterized protein n=1 Tax=Phycicoccus endophyticus TaxID=1690220 RepID=A0A7G9R177_9MICO|nr:hypothetical protein [Phycicoccus endophyticus]NHI20515.1 hypothetical protein [Phycicoccus endophyticus]QNN49352.1 hypothetical protein H9L10_14295 [Phycicoccus endophyticus]GGL45166.1 hypothetical protein GCM10012283_29700 [Phycicoccus endophyticus]
MCSPIRCHSCGKTTWAGCGMHVDLVMAGVAPEQRCTCRDDAAGGPAAGTGHR